jgi:hypothetical protein
MTIQTSANKVLEYFARPDRKWVGHTPMPMHYGDEYKEDCVVTAMSYALENNWVAVDALSYAIRDKIGNMAIGQWNDEEGRTFDDVKTMLQSIANEPTKEN